YNVFEPMGYDAFGLPAENAAIKKGIHPADSTEDNVNEIRKQLKDIGAMYDWSKEINTSNPEYYKWTQWLFLLLYKNGLAYRKKAPVNWCPSCMTVLANEQVVEGLCERCGAEVIQKDLEQWFFKITEYADKLLEGLEKIEWPEKTVIMQKNWIGRSKGASITFAVQGYDENIEVFTTRPDTLWGVTYMVLAPEHELVQELTTPDHKKEVAAYINSSQKETELFRTSLDKEKTGVFTGSYCINPVNKEKIPIWIADYVLMSYGTGAVMAVPAHDQRDFKFAQKFNLPIREVISPDGKEHGELDQAFVDPGIMINSGSFTGENSTSGIQKVISYLDENNWGERRISYKLRDWLISRQRYWGAPIPMVKCEKCGYVPVPEDELPVKLPREVEFTGSGESPLATNTDWVETECPQCRRKALREIDTMDTFVCSSWYFLRYLTPHLDSAPFDKERAEKWLPVYQYVGGAEHAVMHLMYARFVTRVLYDLDLINFDEPFQRLIHQGVITNQGAKMSKSRGNVINPDEYVHTYGSDVFRMYIMFMGSYTEGGDWSEDGIHGIQRFYNRVWRLVEAILENPPQGTETKNIATLERQCHYAVKMVTQDLKRFQFNTCISRIMELVNEMYLYIQNVLPREQNKQILNYTVKTMIQLLSPFAPHLGEELWHEIGNSDSVFDSDWPGWDKDKLASGTVTIVVQVNGRVRTQIKMEADSGEEQVKREALNDPKIQKYTNDKEIVKIIYIKNKLLSIAVK
ncbi:MAG: leucine--tRNA ligase, partial [bacterium]